MTDINDPALVLFPNQPGDRGKPDTKAALAEAIRSGDEAAYGQILTQLGKDEPTFAEAQEMGTDLAVQTLVGSPGKSDGQQESQGFYRRFLGKRKGA